MPFKKGNKLSTGRPKRSYSIVVQRWLNLHLARIADEGLDNLKKGFTEDKREQTL